MAVQSSTSLRRSAAEIQQGIAIVGMAFRFPGGLTDETSLWHALERGHDLVTAIPAERWAVDELQHPKRTEPGRSITFAAGVLSRIDEFDAAFFGISPREAASLDPQQRLLLELSWEAMENAGIVPSSLAGTECAVYVGISSLDYGTRGLDDLASMSSHSMTGNTLSLAANRLSYVFDLRGPSLAVDTACSSSLVALHHACRALQTGEAPAALVGGVSLLLHPYPFVGFTKASMLSADGRCKVFDASGNGYVRAEGGAVLLLKPLDRALADGDDIQAVILASGVNADGAQKTGITIPSRDGQAALMRQVLAKSGLSAHDIDFIEAHGTGTAVGDPIETAAIGAVYGHGRDKPLPIGSVKANLGHMEAASGMAGLVKAILALKHRALPPQIHLATPNPHIDFAGLNLQPVREYTRLEKSGPLVAGVNSFGFGGANAHVLIAEYPRQDRAALPRAPATLPPLVLSARSDAALRALAGRYVPLLDGATPQAYYDIAYAAAYRRERLDKRLALVAANPLEAKEKLDSFAHGGSPAGLVTEDALPEAGGLAFVYSGNGAQWLGMGRRLITESARFAALLADLDARMQPIAGFSLLAELQADASASHLDDTTVAQPLLFALQVALTQLVIEQGLEPTVVMGHSVGEVAAAWACGALDLDAAIRVIVARSQAQGMTRGAGRMAAVGLSAEAMQEVLGQLGEVSDLVIAGINSPNNITLSGSLADLQRVEALLVPRGVFFRLLDLDYAFHSTHMDPIRGPLLERLAGLAPSEGSAIRFLSTVTGAELEGPELGAAYWWRNVREPVRFSAAVARAIQLGCRVFIELGPHAILQRYIGECLSAAGTKGRVLSLQRRGNDGWQSLLDAVLRAHLLAAKPNLDVFFPHVGRPVRLPNYPWQRERHWHPVSSESLLAIERRRVHPLLGWRLPEADQAWENVLDPLILPWLADHKVRGAIVFPGAAYGEMALAAAREWLGGAHWACEELDIVSPMVFDGEHARTVRFELDVRDGGFRVKSRQRLTNDAWTLHAVGRVLQTRSGLSSAQIARPSTPDRVTDRESHYRLTTSLGLEYGPLFQGLKQAIVSGDHLQAELEPPAALKTDGYVIHPALLDVCFQALVHFFQDEIAAEQGVAFLPVKVGRLECYRPAAVTRFRAVLKRRSARSVLADFELFDADDNVLMRVAGCRFRAAPHAQRDQQKITRWHIRPWLRPHPMEGRVAALPSSQALIDAMRQPWEEQEAARRAWYKEALPLFEALLLSLAFESFHALAQAEGDLSPYANASDPYTRWLVNLLQQEGLLSGENGVWKLEPRDALPGSSEIWRTLMAEHSTSWPQLALFARLERALPWLLIHPEERGDFLAGLMSGPAAELLYQDDPAYLGTRLAVEACLRQIAQALPPHCRLRVLEVSPGPSETPRAVLDMLREDRLEYVLAVPEAWLERQQAEYHGYHNLHVTRFAAEEWKIDTERELPDYFDVVILHHVLHQAANPKAALVETRHRLAGGGCLLVAERHPDWSADGLFGLGGHWWRGSVEGHAPCSSLLPPGPWIDALQAEGFEAVRELVEPPALGTAEGAYLIVAHRPAEGVAGRDDSPQPAAWLLIVDAASASLAEHLAHRLEAFGQRVEITGHLEGSDLSLYHHVVHLRGWDASAEDGSNLVSDALVLVQSLARQSRETRVWFITRGGALMSDGSMGIHPNPVQAALWGLGRVVMNEAPTLQCTLIECSCGTDAARTLERLENELLRPDGANEILLTGEGRYTLLLSEDAQATVTPAATDERYRLDFHWPGQLRNLVWMPQQERSLGEAEVEVRVQATGLNFRDVMYLMGLLPDEAVENGFAGASLGLEFSGVATRVGSKVRDVQAGDRVMGFGSACFASHVITRADAIARMPEEWSFAEAATVPTVFFTVYYALKHLANLQPAERVLIHGAAGGVGMAAIQLAKHLGAEVFATAGSPEKRDFVRLLGADRVFDSRSLAFADEIRAATNGEGVDVVLNTLAGEAIRRNLAILRPFGRFIELGKRDFYENTSIGLRPFKDNISYYGVDADQILTARPQLAARLFRELMGLFREGALTPLPHRLYPAERVVDAFRAMQQARHIGKVVVSLGDARPPIERAPQTTPRLALASDVTWLVTGGLSGFGLASARWLVAHGVKHLALVGRRGLETPGAQESLKALTEQGVHVEAFACDIADREAVDHLIDTVRKHFQPLKGILHAAAVFDDALLTNLDATRMTRVLAPKLLGAWHLHLATLDLPLEHFILYSSITTAFGNPGQANYVAANAGLEGLAAMRRAMGLPATCIGWGPIGDVGYLARNTAVKDSLSQRLGKAPLSVEQALEQLGDLLLKGEANIALANFDWGTLARLLPSAASLRFALLNRAVGSAGGAEEAVDFRALIAGKTSEEITALVQGLIVQEVAQVLSITPERIDVSRSLQDMGFDSLMAVELALALEQRFGIQLPPMMLGESPTVERVAARIVGRLLGDPQEASDDDQFGSLVRSMAQQHGETRASEEELQQLADTARKLASR